MRVGFDSDGCLDTFGDGVHETLVATGQGHLWKSGPTKRPFWNFYEDWGWTFAQFKELVDYGVDQGIIFSGHWRPGAIEAVKWVKKMGHEVIIITDRSWGTDPMNSQRNTIKAFAEAGIEYDELHFSTDKCCVQTDMFVEDKIDNYDALKAAGTDVYLIDRAWNQEDDDRMRIPNVMVYANIVALRTTWNRLTQ